MIGAYRPLVVEIKKEETNGVMSLFKGLFTKSIKKPE